MIKQFRHMILLLAVWFGLGCQLTNLVSSVSPAATPTATVRPRPTATAVAAQAVAVPSVPPAPQSQPPPPIYATIMEDNLRVRATPNTSAAILDRLSKGATVQVIGRSAASDWLQILRTQSPDTPGWISAQFAQVNGSLDSVPVAEPGQPPARPPSQPYPRPYP